MKELRDRQNRRICVESSGKYPIVILRLQKQSARIFSPIIGGRPCHRSGGAPYGHQRTDITHASNRPAGAWCSPALTRIMALWGLRAGASADTRTGALASATTAGAAMAAPADRGFAWHASRGARSWSSREIAATGG